MVPSPFPLPQRKRFGHEKVNAFSWPFFVYLALDVYKRQARAKIVNSWNDWDPLKRVIVGRCDNSMIPPEEPATSEKVPVDSEMRGMWGLRPAKTVERGNECLDNLVKILEDRGCILYTSTIY